MRQTGFSRRIRIFFGAAVAALLVWLAAGIPAHADLYVWIDTDGVKHFSNVSPQPAARAKVKKEIAPRRFGKKMPESKIKALINQTTVEKSSGASWTGIRQSESLEIPKARFIQAITDKTAEEVYRFVGRTPDRRKGRNIWIYYDIIDAPSRHRPQSVIIEFKRKAGKKRALRLTFFQRKSY